MTKIAETILSQLGGKSFITITGASNLVAGEDNLQFRIPLNNGINSVVIEYDNNRDDYSITFYNIKGFDFKKVSNFDGVYFDQLTDIFEEQTGLRTSL